MKIEKFKVLLYLKKSGMDKNGKAPIMGRITVNRTMAQFSCKLSCSPSLWNPRASRLEGKSMMDLQGMTRTQRSQESSFRLRRGLRMRHRGLSKRHRRLQQCDDTICDNPFHSLVLFC